MRRNRGILRISNRYLYLYNIISPFSSSSLSFFFFFFFFFLYSGSWVILYLSYSLRSGVSIFRIVCVQSKDGQKKKAK